MSRIDFWHMTHQGLGQRIPADPVTVIDPSKPIVVTSVLGGLHVNYRRAA
jgi:hypothetical protein